MRVDARSSAAFARARAAGEDAELRWGLGVAAREARRAWCEEQFAEAVVARNHDRSRAFATRPPCLAVHGMLH